MMTEVWRRRWRRRTKRFIKRIEKLTRDLGAPITIRMEYDPAYEDAARLAEQRGHLKTADEIRSQRGVPGPVYVPTTPEGRSWHPNPTRISGEAYQVKTPDQIWHYDPEYGAGPFLIDLDWLLQKRWERESWREGEPVPDTDWERVAEVEARLGKALVGYFARGAYPLDFDSRTRHRWHGTRWRHQDERADEEA